MKKTKHRPTTIQTRDDLESVLGEYSAAAIERAAQSAELDAAIHRTRAAYEAVFAQLDETLAALFADLEAWAALHPVEFRADRRSVNLLHGTLGYRLGNPAVRTLKGVKWEHVIEQLRAQRLSGYLRTVEEINKDAILADAPALGVARLAELGLRIEQTDRFYVEPKLEDAAK